MKEENIGRRILEHVCNNISKSIYHKGGPCLQLYLYKNLIFSKKELSGNKVMKGENVGRKILDHACNHFKVSSLQRRSLCRTPFFFSKKEGSGNKVRKEGNIGRVILDHVCEIISKSAPRKIGSCEITTWWSNLFVFYPSMQPCFDF